MGCLAWLGAVAVVASLAPLVALIAAVVRGRRVRDNGKHEAPPQG